MNKTTEEEKAVMYSECTSGKPIISEELANGQKSLHSGFQFSDLSVFILKHEICSCTSSV